ncbi:MAG: biotin transporter BioY [Chlamydiae bacterium]|nr:biotin transporter BioY [Chlamydiota bacterium]
MKILVISQDTAISSQVKDRLYSFLQIVLASCFIGLVAQIKIPLYFTPVPLTGQTFAIMLMGALLGPRKGAQAALLYLVEGCMGLPVWAGGQGGLIHLLGPTGGYLLAYPLQAYLIGSIFKRVGVSLIRATSALFLCCILQLLLGSLWLGFFVGSKNMLTMGCTPFLPGEALKALLVASFIKTRKN